MAASTMAPIATAIPPRDMMLAVTRSRSMGMNERIIAIGIVMIGMMALGICHRKIRITTLTITISSVSVCRRASMARTMRSERSYVGTIFTPGGSDGSISLSLALTALMTLRAFSP